MTTRPRIGTARDAARILGVSLATLHRSRAAGALVLDHAQGGKPRPLSSQERADRRWQRTQHLIAPALFGQQLPGRPWTFHLDRLERQLDQGPPGAPWDPGDL